MYAINGAPSQTWGCLPPGRKVVTYLQELPSLAQLPLLNQIQDPLLNKKGSEVWNPPRDARNVMVPHWGVGTGTLDELADSHTRLTIYPPSQFVTEGL